VKIKTPRKIYQYKNTARVFNTFTDAEQFIFLHRINVNDVKIITI
jgi:hypothetical protein